MGAMGILRRMFVTLVAFCLLILFLIAVAFMVEVIDALGGTLFMVSVLVVLGIMVFWEEADNMVGRFWSQKATVSDDRQG